MNTKRKREIIKNLQLLITISQTQTLNSNFEESMNTNYRILHNLSILMEEDDIPKEELKVYTKSLISVCKWTASAIKQRKPILIFVDTITLNHLFKTKKNKIAKRDAFTIIDTDIIKDEFYSNAEDEKWFEVAYNKSTWVLKGLDLNARIMTRSSQLHFIDKVKRDNEQKQLVFLQNSLNQTKDVWKEMRLSRNWCKLYTFNFVVTIKSKRKNSSLSPNYIEIKEENAFRSNYKSPSKFIDVNIDYLENSVILPSGLNYIPEDHIGMEKIKKVVSNNIFKPLMNKELISHFEAFPKSVLIHGPHETGKLTMAKYIAHQLQWKVLSFSCTEILSAEPAGAKTTIYDSFNYCFNNSPIIYLIKDLDVILNLDQSKMKSFNLKTNIIDSFKELLLKFHNTQGKNILAIFLLNGKLSQFKEKGHNFIDNFELHIKFKHLNMDDIGIYMLKKLEGHNHEFTWKHLLEFSHKLSGSTWPTIRRVVNCALRKPFQFVTEDNVFDATDRSVLKTLNILHFNEALKEEKLDKEDY